MLTQKKWLGILVGTIAAFVLALGAVSFFTSASEAASIPLFNSQQGGKFHHGGMRNQHDSFLADALGITVEELQAAREEARAAALQQAVAKGLITQEQADQLQNGNPPNGFDGPPPLGQHGFRGTIDHEALLADALGITVEELQAAHEEARQAALEQAIADGRITQEQAEMMQAHDALRSYLDRDALMAKALGISVEELQAAQAEGKSLPALIEELGLDRETVQANMQAAHEEAIQQAVADGVITQEQADQILSQEGPGFGPPHPGHGFRGRGAFQGREGVVPSFQAPPGLGGTSGNDGFQQQMPANDA